MLGRVVKIEEKTLLWRLWLFGKNKEPSTFTGRLWNAVITSRHKMEIKYSDTGTLFPLVHCSTDRWTFAYGTRLHDVQCLKSLEIVK